MTNYSKIVPNNEFESYEDYINSIDYFYDYKSWSDASEIDTKESYEKYLDKYPKGLNADKAKIIINEIIKDKELWSKTFKDDTKEAYIYYINEAKHQRYINDAKQKIDKIMLDEKAWSIAKNKDTKESYQKYLKQFPNGIYKEEANTRFNKILNDEKLKIEEENQWKKTKKSDTINAYEKYITTYKNSIYVNEARQRFDELKKDKTAWETAKKLNTVVACKNYIKDYPKGKFLPQAIQKRDNLLEIKEQDKMWKRMERLDTKNSYTKYLNKYPNGRHSFEAKKRIDEFSAKDKNDVSKEEKQVWENCKKVNTTTVYSNYMRKFTKGIFYDEARKRFDVKNEEELWEIANQHNDNSSKHLEGLERYLENTKLGKYEKTAKKKINKINKELKLAGYFVMFVGYGIILVVIYFIFFHVSDTKFSLYPSDPDRVIINGETYYISSGDEIELPYKYNTITVEKKGYKTKIVDDVEQGIEQIIIELDSIYGVAEKYYSDKKYKKAFDLFKQISEDKRTWFYLGYLYKNVDKDYNRSKKFYEKACHNDSGASCNNLGSLYEYGQGTAIDKKKAFQYYKKSADLGDDYGACNTALAYYVGGGVSEDIDLAKKYLKNATTDIESCNKLKKTINNLEVFYDKSRNLMWQDNKYTNKEKKAYKKDINYNKVGNIEYAKTYCKNLTIGSYFNWRLPSKNELIDLYKKKNNLNNISSDYFSSFYWSSSIDTSGTKAWAVRFYDGNGNYNNGKQYSAYIRCVRSKTN